MLQQYRSEDTDVKNHINHLKSLQGRQCVNEVKFFLFNNTNVIFHTRCFLTLHISIVGNSETFLYGGEIDIDEWNIRNLKIL